MSKAPSMPIYWDAYIADTTHLSTEEHGAYLLLLAAMWRRDGTVPDDDKDNARIVGLSVAKWKRFKARALDTISGFSVENGKILQKKLYETYQEVIQKIEKNRTNGVKGGRPKSKPKYKENNDLGKANGFVSDNPNETIPEPEPYREKEEGKPSSKKKRGSRLPDDWALPKEWGDWALTEGWSDAIIRLEAEKFKDYWHSVAGQKGSKLDWQATWRNWMRNSSSPKVINGSNNGRPTDKGEERLSAFIAGARGA